MNIVFEGIFGSKLYGTDTEHSDTDIKGVFMPSIEDLVLMKTPKTFTEVNKVSDGNKMTVGDVESQYFSIHQFLHLLTKGEMTVLDMLHTPANLRLRSSQPWECLYESRKCFYAKNMHGYLGYVKAQTAKYSERGARLKDCEEVLKFLSQLPEDQRVSSYYESLPDLKYTKKFLADNSPLEDKRIYEIAGRKITAGTKVGYAKEIVANYVANYGHRAIAAKENGGIDFKALSHAFRACYQLQEITETGDLVFPLKRREFIRNLKYGKIEGDIFKLLDALVDETVEKLSKSNLPTKPTFDTENFLLSLYGFN